MYMLRGKYIYIYSRHACILFHIEKRENQIIA